MTPHIPDLIEGLRGQLDSGPCFIGFRTDPAMSRRPHWLVPEY
jgi:hypothetical protein